MEHAFPYRFEPQESGGVLVQFIDVPEAHTFGATETDAGGDHALDCLVAAKLALYEAMRAQRITRSELARRLGLQENGVRRLLDLDHRSHIDQVDRALAALGKRLEVRVLEPA